MKSDMNTVLCWVQIHHLYTVTDTGYNYTQPSQIPLTVPLNNNIFTWVYLHSMYPVNIIYWVHIVSTVNCNLDELWENHNTVLGTNYPIVPTQTYVQGTNEHAIHNSR